MHSEKSKPSGSHRSFLFVSWALGIALFIFAAAIAPTQAKERQTTALTPPPKARVLSAMALARDDAAADALWLRTIQFIGHPDSEAQKYEGLENWIERINTLAPSFELPYYTGSILLATEPERAKAAATIMDRAIENLNRGACFESPECSTPSVFEDVSDSYTNACKPCDAYRDCTPDMYMWRGFVSYFGEFDNQSAAHYYCEAAKRDGPEYLQRMAPRLIREKTQCDDLRRDLINVQRSERSVGRALDSRMLTVALACETQSIKQASEVARITLKRNAETIDELVQKGFLEKRPWTPSNEMCWKLEKGSASLVNCPRR